MTHDEILAQLIIANLKHNKENETEYVYYRKFEIDTPRKFDKTNAEIAREIIDQIYEVEKIDYPKLTKGEIDSIMSRIEGVKSCLLTNRKHINETASTISEKCMLLEKLSYNIESKIDGVISDLEESFRMLENENE